MRIIDTHCDALYKLQKYKQLSFQYSTELQTNLKRLKAGNIKVQFFAIFLDPGVSTDKAWEKTIEQIKLFHSKIIKEPRLVHITKWDQIKHLKRDEIGAVLTLEGAESFGNDLNKLNMLYRVGVMSIGLTWNLANLCADGSNETRGAGLTLLGKEVIKRNNKHHVLTDVSHISERGFWELIEHSDFPFASHSNAKKICDHPRNLNDDQIIALIKKKSPIHLVFYPPFVKERGRVTIKHLLKHIDHICSLGGEKYIGFGSDFDGIDDVIFGLEDASTYYNFINELLKYYTEEQVHGYTTKNFENFLINKNLM